MVAFQGLCCGSIKKRFSQGCKAIWKMDWPHTLGTCNFGMNVPTVARAIVSCSPLKGLKCLRTKLNFPRVTSEACFRSLRHPLSLFPEYVGKSQLSLKTGLCASYRGGSDHSACPRGREAAISSPLFAVMLP